MLRFFIIDLFRGTKVLLNYLSYIRLYRSSKSIEEISLQNQKLVEFLTTLSSHPIFSNYLKDVSLDDIKSNPESILKSLPITDKEFITERFKTFLYVKSEKYEHNYTGGSTGSPFHYILDKITISKTRAFNYYLWNKYLGYNLGERILVIGGSSLGTNKSLKKRVYNFLQNKIFIPGDIVGKASSDAHIKSLLNKKYKVIYGYPSSILSYIEYAKKNNISFINKIKGVITTSEMLYDMDKAIIESFFSAPVLNVYGANDGGVISGSIDNKNFIFNGLDCYIEEYYENGLKEPELLLTNLNSRVFPFVRYRVGDIGNLDKGSALGSFVINNLKGRTRDFFKNTKGDTFHGSLLNKILKNIKGIIRYQLIQDKDYNIRFYLQLSVSEDNNAIKVEVCRHLEELISDSEIVIKVIITNDFLKFSNNKHKLVICNVV